MAVIRVIHQLRDGGLSLRAISQRLSDEGVRARAGKALHHALIARILKGSPPDLDGFPPSPDSRVQPSTATGGVHVGQ